MNSVDLGVHSRWTYLAMISSNVSVCVVETGGFAIDLSLAICTSTSNSRILFYLLVISYRRIQKHISCLFKRNKGGMVEYI